MKRPLAVFAVLFLFTQLLAIKIPQTAVKPLAVFFVIAVIVATIAFKKRKCSLLCFAVPLGVGVGFLWWCMYTAVFVTPITLLANGELRTINAVVLDIESGYTDELRKGTLRVTAIDNEKNTFPFKTISYNMEDAELGDIIEMQVQFEPITTKAQQSYQYSQQVYVTADARSDVTVLGNRTTLGTLGKKIKKEVSVMLSFCMPKAEAGVAAAVLTGDKSNLSNVTTANFQKAGISHLLVVSGFHISLVAATLYSLLKKLFSKSALKEYVAVAGALASTVLYVAIVGFTASAIRAGIMVSAYFCAKLMGRHADGFTSLGVAALALTVHNPFIVYRAGFWLSFSSTFGVMLFSKWQADYHKRPRKSGPVYQLTDKLGNIVGTPVAATFATLPVILAIGGGVSLFGVFANIIASILVTYILSAGMVTILIYGVIKFKLLAHIIAYIVAFLTKALIWLAEGVANLPGYVYIGSTATFILCLDVYVLMAIGIKQKSYKKYAALAFVLLTLGVALQVALTKDTVTIAMVGHTQNPAIVLIQNSQAAVIYRGADKNAPAVQDYLQTRNLAQAELLIDLRTSGTRADYEDYIYAKQVLTVEQEIANAQTISLFHDIIVTVQHQAQGNLACIDVGGYKAALTAGTTDFGHAAQIDVLFAGTGKVSGLKTQKIIARTKWDWLNQPQYDEILFKSTGTPQIWVRPGKAMIVKEVEEWF